MAGLDFEKVLSFVEYEWRIVPDAESELVEIAVDS